MTTSTEAPAIRLMIIDDHPIVRFGLNAPAACG